MKRFFFSLSVVESRNEKKKIKMRTKSFPVRSQRQSFDPSPSLPGRFGCEEMVRDTCGGGDKKRHCRLGTDREPLRSDACVVCGISDNLVSPCCGINCRVVFHGKCLTPEFGGSEDLSNPFCPYCWFKIVSLKSKSLREQAIEAEKAVCKYLDKEIASDQGLHGGCSSKEDQVQDDKGKRKFEVGTGMKEDQVIDDQVKASEEEERISTEKEHGHVQQNEKQRRRRLEMNATDSEISPAEEPNGDHVTEHVTNHHKKLKVAAKSKTLRDVSFFNKDQRRRLLWTPEEEEMLKVGVEKFAAEANRNMPWRKILEMGEKVFHQTRTPTDLKDKWRNMLKATTH
ncbi:unnamed protein product [Thlaspi arvense]|uniref:Myb-like domain-containing protein n=1 Tax=Thlaspi arvense TaxID=13288 RepID=A0AAU9SBY1_THLAR|nr:unnamed protein product [Thlaspi arvense]